METRLAFLCRSLLYMLITFCSTFWPSGVCWLVLSGRVSASEADTCPHFTLVHFPASSCLFSFFLLSCKQDGQIEDNQSEMRQRSELLMNSEVFIECTRGSNSTLSWLISGCTCLTSWKNNLTPTTLIFRKVGRLCKMYITKQHMLPNPFWHIKLKYNTIY